MNSFNSWVIVASRTDQGRGFPSSWRTPRSMVKKTLEHPNLKWMTGGSLILGNPPCVTHKKRSKEDLKGISWEKIHVQTRFNPQVWGGLLTFDQISPPIQCWNLLSRWDSPHCLGWLGTVRNHQTRHHVTPSLGAGAQIGNGD